jgi:hypothetical protein
LVNLLRFYLAGPRTLKAFIDIVTADEESGFPANTDEINLVGRSFGGTTVLFYMKQRMLARILSPLLNLSSCLLANPKRLLIMVLP